MRRSLWSASLVALVHSSWALAADPAATRASPAASNTPPRVAVQTTSTDPAAAAELFVEGRAAMAASRYAEACPKFSESFRLDPHVGSLISLAECEAGAGHLLLSRTHWLLAIDFAHRMADPRESVAAERFKDIDLRVPRLTLRWSVSAPAGATVAKDGVIVSALTLDAPIPIESGEHVVTVSAPGYADRTVSMSAAEGESKDVALAVGPPLPPAEVAAPPHAEARPTPPGWTRRKTAATVTAGVGGLACWVGAGFGVATLIQSKQPSGSCPGGQCNMAAQARNEAFVWGDVSTGFFIGGGVLFSAAAAIWLVPARAPASSTGWTVVPNVGKGAASLQVGTAF